VNLKAVSLLQAHTPDADVRTALMGVMSPGYSSSVVLAAVAALQHLAGSDQAVRRGFFGAMENDGLSSRARIRAGDALLAGADAPERTRIADAMEDVIVDIDRERWGDWTHDTIEDALDVVQKIDPARAAALRQRHLR
jgi:hypothetical protein